MQLPAVTTKAEVAFAEVAMPISDADSEYKVRRNQDILPAAVVKYNGLTIELSNDISEVLLGRLFKEVYHA